MFVKICGGEKPQQLYSLLRRHGLCFRMVNIFSSFLSSIQDEGGAVMEEEEEEEEEEIEEVVPHPDAETTYLFVGKQGTGELRSLFD